MLESNAGRSLRGDSPVATIPSVDTPVQGDLEKPML